MPPPSSSHNHYSPPKNQKQLHQRAKKRSIRRRRIDLFCGCTIYVHINCANDGFTHRGDTHAIANAHWHVILGIEEPSLHQANREGYGQQVEPSVPHDNNVQPQPPQITQSSQGSIPFPDLDKLLYLLSMWSKICTFTTFYLDSSDLTK
ncbi:hypothetical protein U1Q18_012348 [Sarracenia purpurea var. burkii]